MGVHEFGSTPLYFPATNGSDGAELWQTDRTKAGTVILKDINSTSDNAHASPAELTAYEGILYFRATDGKTGKELWKTDGTQANTSQVKDINTGGGTNPTNITAVEKRGETGARCPAAIGFPTWNRGAGESRPALFC